MLVCGAVVQQNGFSVEINNFKTPEYRQYAEIWPKPTTMKTNGEIIIGPNDQLDRNNATSLFGDPFGIIIRLKISIILKFL